MTVPHNEPKLYSELAAWWPLLSPPSEYAEEAAYYRRVLNEACAVPPRTLLELGSGGGNVASYLRPHLQLTLVDRSPGMLAVSQALNPDCEHVPGDMRTVRLGRTFDAIFVHDAVMYLTTEDDLRRAMETCFVHCRPGGVAVLVPDWVRETFRPSTDHGGHDDGPRGLRFLEWTWDPDPADTTFFVDFAFLLRSADGAMRTVYDRHVFGLFGRDDWLRLLRAVGFRPTVVTDPWERDIFVGVRPAD